MAFVLAFTYTPEIYFGIPSALPVDDTQILQFVLEEMAPKLPLILVAVAALPLIDMPQVPEAPDPVLVTV